MPITDEDGTEHIVAIDEITAWGIAHLTQCERCQKRFSNSLARLKRQGYDIVSDEFKPKLSIAEQDSIEDDLNRLHDLDNQIKGLITRRTELVKMVTERIHKSKDRLYASEEWFEGSVRGNPVPDRGDECVEAPLRRSY